MNLVKGAFLYLEHKLENFKGFSFKDRIKDSVGLCGNLFCAVASIPRA